MLKIHTKMELNKIMSILLKDVYEETKNKYGLRLIAGEAGLSAVMNWVYIAESVVGPGYLSGSELIITTGVLCRESPEWLYHFIEAMIEEHTCGMILNIGRYLWPAHITPEILELCNQHNYPLFTMPWETLITNVTRDYYNRIFRDSQKEDALASAFWNLVHRRGDQEAALSSLNEFGFPPQTACCALHVGYQLEALEEQEQRRMETRIRLTLYHQLQDLKMPFQICGAAGTFLIVLLPSAVSKSALVPGAACSDTVSRPSQLSGSSQPSQPSQPSGSSGSSQPSRPSQPSGAETRISCFTHTLARLLVRRFPTVKISVGCGSLQPSLNRLPQSYFQAQAAAAFAAAGGCPDHESGASFEELGFYRILLSVSDREALRSYAASLLEPVDAYEKKHQGGDLAATLEAYLLCGGSIQSAAARLYCHRNTVNKRIRVLREELSYDLDNPQVCFELNTAFAIRRFLELFP